jgi:hypothetical protein
LEWDASIVLKTNVAEAKVWRLSDCKSYRMLDEDAQTGHWFRSISLDAERRVVATLSLELVQMSYASHLWFAQQSNAHALSPHIKSQHTHAPLAWAVLQNDCRTASCAAKRLCRKHMPQMSNEQHTAFAPLLTVDSAFRRWRPQGHSAIKNAQDAIQDHKSGARTWPLPYWAVQRRLKAAGWIDAWCPLASISHLARQRLPHDRDEAIRMHTRRVPHAQKHAVCMHIQSSILSWILFK